MLEYILDWDRDIFLLLNSFHHPWIDPLMFYGSKSLTWLPLYFLLLYRLVRLFGKNVWIALAGVTLTLLVSDQVTSGFMKPFFERLRPSQEPGLAGIIHLVNGYKGGLYGFASSHAANSFATATFFWLILHSRIRTIGLLFLWAFFMSYTRIYLGVHYPVDILVGALVGVAAGTIGWAFCRILLRKQGLSEFL